MHSASMSRAGLNLGSLSTSTQSPGEELSIKFLRLAHLHKLRRCEQVAAVCFRIRVGVIEFLLVRTRKERWIFPKGSAEPGLTHAQAAALEAFEEGGVHGRMEESSFIRYVQRKRGKMGRTVELSVSAHLCEVLRLVRPPESNRTPTWFSAEKAKRRLRDDRTVTHGNDLARVIDKAVTRLLRLRSEPTIVDPTSQAQIFRPPLKVARQRARLIDIDSGRAAVARIASGRRSTSESRTLPAR